MDPSLLRQAVLNLAVNARDAMPEGGVVAIDCKNVQVSGEDSLAHRGSTAGNYVCLTVTDTGHGIAPDILERIFEPFFTTKPDGRGTGLGLAVVHGAVGCSGGFIDISSTQNAGTTFRLYLPRADELHSPRSETPDASHVESRGHNIILVEDQDVVRHVVTKTLEVCGHRVRTFDSPTACLHAMRTTPFDAELLLTDLMMPGMNGVELADAVAELLPNIRVLIMSGFTGALSPSGHAMPPGDLLLPKPFSPSELQAAILRTIGAPSSWRRTQQSGGAIDDTNGNKGSGV